MDRFRGEVIRAADVVASQSKLEVLIEVFTGMRHDEFCAGDERLPTMCVMRLVVPKRATLRSGAEKKRDDSLVLFRLDDSIELDIERVVDIEEEMKMLGPE